MFKSRNLKFSSSGSIAIIFEWGNLLAKKTADNPILAPQSIMTWGVVFNLTSYSLAKNTWNNVVTSYLKLLSVTGNLI